MNLKLSFILLLFISCDSQRVFEDFHTTDAIGWHKDSIAVFNVDIDDTTINYNILVGCRNIENYPYSNLWLFVDIVAPDSMVLRDTIEYQLAQPNGKWIGNGAGGVYFNKFGFRSNVFFPLSGKYEIKVQHAMRDDKLMGLKNIGIRVETIK